MLTASQGVQFPALNIRLQEIATLDPGLVESDHGQRCRFDDIEACRIRKAIEKFADRVDADKVALTGGSHGGFLTGWLSGHLKYRDIWKATCVRNAVFDMNYMNSCTDIPDWIIACCFNKELD